MTLRDIFRDMSHKKKTSEVKETIKKLNEFTESVKENTRVVYAKSLNSGTLIYLKIPSSKKNIDYDIAFWFGTQTKIGLDVPVKVYCNTPNFGYTYAYVFNLSNGLLFPTYYPKEFTEIEPKTKNPTLKKGFDKYVYASLKHLADKNLNDYITQFKEQVEPKVVKFVDRMKDEPVAVQTTE